MSDQDALDKDKEMREHEREARERDREERKGKEGDVDDASPAPAANVQRGQLSGS